jgi:hypothetical protein
MADHRASTVRSLLVRVPAAALMVVGFMAILLFLVVLLWNALGWIEGPFGKYQNDPALASTLWTFAIGSAVYGLTLIAGGWQLRKLDSYEFTVLSSFIAVLPALTTPWWNDKDDLSGLVLVAVLGLLAGLWALAVLWRREVRDAFSDEHGTAHETRSEAAQLVHNPAWGLIITGLISWVTIPLAFWFPILEDMNVTQRTIFQITFGVIPLIVGTTMALAGFRMRRLEGYRLAVFTAVLPIVVLVVKLICVSFGTLAINPSDLVGAPIGLWVLVVLSRSDVKTAFN